MLTLLSHERRNVIQPWVTVVCAGPAPLPDFLCLHPGMGTCRDAVVQVTSSGAGGQHQLSSKARTEICTGYKNWFVCVCVLCFSSLYGDGFPMSQGSQDQPQPWSILVSVLKRGVQHRLQQQGTTSIGQEHTGHKGRQEWDAAPPAAALVSTVFVFLN